MRPRRGAPPDAARHAVEPLPCQSACETVGAEAFAPLPHRLVAVDGHGRAPLQRQALVQEHRAGRDLPQDVAANAQLRSSSAGHVSSDFLLGGGNRRSTRTPGLAAPARSLIVDR